MYLYFLFYTTMSECMILYGPTVPEINYSILFYKYIAIIQIDYGIADIVADIILTRLKAAL